MRANDHLPLSGCRVIELAGVGPAPFAAMMLGELGADVVRIERVGGERLFPGAPELEFTNRGKRSVRLNLKEPAAVAAVLRAVSVSDILIEGYRPGAAERLGLGPADCLKANPSLVYGRMTGWGQDGPRAGEVGHDINYLAITGALHAIGPAESPAIPLNLLGDFGGGGTYLVTGILAALRQAESTGRGQVVDAAIVDGVLHLMTGIHAMAAAGAWKSARQSNLLDGAAPFYCTYRTSDGGHVAVGAIESRFFSALIDGTGVDIDLDRQHDVEYWPVIRERLATAFSGRTRDEWQAHFAGTEACVTPVLSIQEAAADPHLRARGSFTGEASRLQARPAPRLSLVPEVTPSRPPLPGADSREILAEWGLTSEEIANLTV